MSRLRAGFLAVTLALGLTMAVVPRADALAFTQQCDQSGGCMNVWGGGTLIKSWYGTAANNEIAVQWLPGGYFQLRNNVYGGCVGDNNGAQGDAKAGANDDCNSTATGGGGGWGTRFRPVYECPSGWAVYENVHWSRYIYIPPGNGQQIYLNTGTPDCLQQEA